VIEPQNYIGYMAYKVLTSLFFCLPRPLCLAAGRLFGQLAFYLDRTHRAIVLTNLETAFGQERSKEERTAIARRFFQHFGRLLADILKISHFSRDKVLRLVTTEGRLNLEEALAQSKGVLVFTAHFGNWELAAVPLSEIGPLRAVVRALDNPLLEKDLARLRMRLGCSIIYKFGAVRPILRALGRDEIVAILIDQNVLRSQAVFIDFFGRRAATTPSLAAFHIKTGAPLVPIFVYPSRGGRYVLKILESFQVASSGRPEEDVLKITQICTKIIEREIRQRPELWFWIHNRWKTRPVDEETTA